jgi:hypothetical protein
VVLVVVDSVAALVVLLRRSVDVATQIVNIFEVAAEITALSECLVALLADKWPLPRVLSEVVPQIAGLLEHRVAAGVHTFEVEFDALGLRVPDLDGLVPVGGHSFECLGVALFV